MTSTTHPRHPHSAHPTVPTAVSGTSQPYLLDLVDGLAPAP